MCILLQNISNSTSTCWILTHVKSWSCCESPLAPHLNCCWLWPLSLKLPAGLSALPGSNDWTLCTLWRKPCPQMSPGKRRELDILAEVTYYDVLSPGCPLINLQVAFWGPPTAGCSVELHALPAKPEVFSAPSELGSEALPAWTVSPSQHPPAWL